MGEATPCGKICDNCGSDFVFLTTRDVYSHHRQASGWNVIYYCGSCTASVGTHSDSIEPLGKMATARTRYLRSKAHSTFDVIWRCGLMTRNAAIRWAAKELMIIDEFHISTLSDEDLIRLIEISQRELINHNRYNLTALEARNKERITRDAKRISDYNSREAKRRRKNR